MAEEKLLTVRDTSIILGMSEKEVLDLAENGTLPAYKVGGVYLRFKKEQIQEFLKSDRQPVSKTVLPEREYPVADKVSDFFYFNDFYLLAALIILVLLVIIFRG